MAEAPVRFHVPLRSADSDTSGPETPESLFLSALLEHGEFTPERFKVGPDDLTCWKDLYRFGVAYQKDTGVSPPWPLVRQRFPTFEPIYGIGVTWAAKQVLEAAADRNMRNAMRAAASMLETGDVGAASELLRASAPPLTVVKPPLNGLDDWLVDAEDQGPRLPVPYRSLTNVTGGIGPGEMWLLGGRPGMGKTHIASVLMAEMMREGAKVGLLSLEMPGRVMRRRVTRVLTKGEKDLLQMLGTAGLDHQKAMAKIRERTPGSLDIIDPSYGRITPDVVREFMEGHDIVVVDHVGLLGTNAGGRSIDDWRLLGGISNQLIEDKLATGTPILGMVQLNRRAEEGSPRMPPGTSTIAGADVLVQDADVILTIRRPTQHVMVMGAMKNREGPPARWWTEFNPATIAFGEIPYDRANTLIDEDEALSQS